MTRARVVPLLFRLDNPDVGLPLSRFQMKPASREGILDIVRAINASAHPDRKLDEAVLLGTFESVWPKLESKLNAMPEGPEARERSDRELLEEMLELTRGSRINTSQETVILGEAASKSWLRRLKSIVGEDGSVELTPGTVIARSPRFANFSSLDEDEVRFLTQFGLDLGYNNMDFRIKRTTSETTAAG